MLTSENVQRIFRDCLFDPGEKPTEDEYVKVEGIIATYGLNPVKLALHEAEISAMLADLPDEFHEWGGGGWSFLNACLNRRGEQWTDLHAVMEMLFVLGMAVRRVICMVPRSMWNTLPGDMPYYLVTTPEPIPPFKR